MSTPEILMLSILRLLDTANMRGETPPPLRGLATKVFARLDFSASDGFDLPRISPMKPGFSAHLTRFRNKIQHLTLS